jgi:hypothetical protein
MISLYVSNFWEMLSNLTPVFVTGGTYPAKHLFIFFCLVFNPAFCSLPFNSHSILISFILFVPFQRNIFSYSVPVSTSYCVLYLTFFIAYNTLPPHFVHFNIFYVFIASSVLLFGSGLR